MDEKLVRGISLGIQLQHAIRFAAESHQGQSYGSDGLPYLLHLSQVLGELRLICNENVHNLLAGLLHILLGFPLVVFPLHRTHVASQRNDVSAQDTRTSCLSWQSK